MPRQLSDTSKKIPLMDYNSNWPRLFRWEADRIRSALGRRALHVEHIGSTAVPGLAAKPVIDVLVAVFASADEDSYLPALEDAGYVLTIREPGWHQHRMLNRPDTNVNVHVFSSGCPEIDRVLTFRNWLRANPADRDLYASTKLILAENEWRSIESYEDAKPAVIEEILARAQLAMERQGSVDSARREPSDQVSLRVHAERL